MAEENETHDEVCPNHFESIDLGPQDHKTDDSEQLVMQTDEDLDKFELVARDFSGDSSVEEMPTSGPPSIFFNAEINSKDGLDNENWSMINANDLAEDDVGTVQQEETPSTWDTARKQTWVATKKVGDIVYNSGIGSVAKDIAVATAETGNEGLRWVANKGLEYSGRMKDPIKNNLPGPLHQWLKGTQAPLTDQEELTFGEAVIRGDIKWALGRPVRSYSNPVSKELEYKPDGFIPASMKSCSLDNDPEHSHHKEVEGTYLNSNNRAARHSIPWVIEDTKERRAQKERLQKFLDSIPPVGGNPYLAGLARKAEKEAAKEAKKMAKEETEKEARKKERIEATRENIRHVRELYDRELKFQAQLRARRNARQASGPKESTTCTPGEPSPYSSSPS